MSAFVLEYGTESGGHVSADLDIDVVKYWAGEGLPTFEGPLDGFAVMYPAVVAEMVRNSALRVTD